MKRIIYSILLVTLFVGAVLFIPKNAVASEGTIEIRSTTNESYRCWASSLFMPNNKYKVSIGCIDLIYPPQPPKLYEFYVLWAAPLEKGNPTRLGLLGIGKNNFDVAKPFSELFVSLEETNAPKTPSSEIVMRGRVQPINFLLRPTSPTPTPTIAPVKNEAETVDEASESDTTQMSTKDKIVLALRRAGIAAVVALVVIIGLVFVVSRSRG